MAPHEYVTRVRPWMTSIVISVCQWLTEQTMTPKEFFYTFLTADDEVLKHRRGKWGDTGWSSTLDILYRLKDISTNTRIGNDNWRAFILAEAQLLVHQDLKSMKSTFYSSQEVSADFFTLSSMDERARVIRNGLPFLYTLIHSQLSTKPTNKELLMRPREASTFELKRIGTSSTSRDMNDGDDSLDSDEEDILDSTVFQRSQTLAGTIAAMVAFAYNRRNNGHQVHNSLTFVANGVSCRVHEYLHYLGLTTSRPNALDFMRSLRVSQEAMTKKAMLKCEHLLPILCIDNFDVMKRVFNTRVNATNHMFHGTWGYLHFIPSFLVRELEVKWPDFCLNSLLEHMDGVDTKPVTFERFRIRQDDQDYGILVIKSQLATALKKYILQNGQKTRDELKTSPPPIDKIPMYEPDVVMLKMMDVAENSAEGVAQVFEEFARQSGRSWEDIAKLFLLLMGDLGTCANVESLRKKRFPSGFKDEGLRGVITILGASHVLWNVAQSLLVHHWGNSRVRDSHGAWKVWQALGGSVNQPPANMDFATVMMVVNKVHMAYLVSCLKQVIDDTNSGSKLSDQGIASMVISECYERYCSPECLMKAEVEGDLLTYNQCQLIRDFATVVEADQASHAGDVGRLVRVWKQWVLMAHGMKGLPRYALHLTRFILLVEEDLPEVLGKIIKYTILLPTGGRDNHWVPKDLWLEHNNYFLKYFYNQTGNGTDTYRLMDFSILMPIFRDLLTQLQIRSGRKVIHQSRNYDISPSSLKNVLKTSNFKPTNQESSYRTDKVIDCLDLGTMRFQQNIRKDYISKSPSRYRWGFSVFAQDEEDNIDEEVLVTVTDSNV